MRTLICAMALMALTGAAGAAHAHVFEVTTWVPGSPALGEDADGALHL